jgi:cell wall-associated NlpC family hydrolase
MAAADVVKAAVSKIGTVEKGGADGKSGNIVEFWDWWKAQTGQNDQGQSWCAVFVSWCYAQVPGGSALVAAKTPHGFIYCPDGVNFFKAHHQIVDPKTAQPGDIIFFDWENKGIADHVGIVEKNNKANLTTIEGNTSEEGAKGSQSNGGGVYRRTRYFGPTIHAVARPIWPAAK